MRESLARTLRRTAVVAMFLALSSAGCEDPTGPISGITAVSEVVNGHSHRATIPLSDINDPLPGGRDYTSTTDAGHAHLVHLSQQQLTDLQQRGAALSVSSGTRIPPDPPDNHVHVFEFVR